MSGRKATRRKSPRPSSGTPSLIKKGKGKGKKKKKLSKAALAELERKHEEERLRREQEERERLERERREIEERERRLREEQERRRQQEKERRDAEAKDVNEWAQSRQKWLDDQDAQENSLIEWQKYRSCLGRPNSDLEHEVNSFMRLWEENNWDNIWPGEAHKTALFAAQLDDSPTTPEELDKERTWLRELARGRHGGLMEELEMAQLCEEVVCEMKHQAMSAAEQDDPKRAKTLWKKCEEMRDLVRNRLDMVTADVLQHSDEYANLRNEVKFALQTRTMAAVRTQSQSPGVTPHPAAAEDDSSPDTLKDVSFKFGLWINLAKNPRLKSIDFADLQLSIDLPKSLALASVALRLTQTSYDHVGHLSHGPFYSIGHVFATDLLALPPAPKRVKGWTLRQLNTGASVNPLRRLPYPLQKSGTAQGSAAEAGAPSDRPTSATRPASGTDRNSESGDTESERKESVAAAAPPTLPGASSGASQYPPLRIQFRVPEGILFDPESPHIGYWNDETKEWAYDGVEDVGASFEPGTRVLTFHSMRLMPLSIVAERYEHFPLESWCIRPIVKAEVTRPGAPKVSKGGKTGVANLAGVFQLTTPKMIVEIGISNDDTCYLLKPELNSLAHLSDPDHARRPTAFLNALRDAGICLLYDENIETEVQGLKPKTREVEEQLERDLSFMAPAMAMMWSRWNISRPNDKCVFRTKPNIGTSDEPHPDDDDWDLMVYQTVNCSVVQSAENGEVFDEEMTEGIQGHANFIANVKQKYSPAVYERCRTASPRFAECVRLLLKLIRPFSFAR